MAEARQLAQIHPNIVVKIPLVADGLRAVVAQTLFKRIDKKGRVAALEIMIANPAVRNLIREAKSHQLPSMMQTGKKYGMQTLDDAILEHLKKGRISPPEYRQRSPSGNSAACGSTATSPLMTPPHLRLISRSECCLQGPAQRSVNLSAGFGQSNLLTKNPK